MHNKEATKIVTLIWNWSCNRSQISNSVSVSTNNNLSSWLRDPPFLFLCSYLAAHNFNWHMLKSYLCWFKFKCYCTCLNKDISVILSTQITNLTRIWQVGDDIHMKSKSTLKLIFSSGQPFGNKIIEVQDLTIKNGYFRTVFKQNSGSIAIRTVNLTCLDTPHT